MTILAKITKEAASGKNQTQNAKLDPIYAAWAKARVREDALKKMKAGGK